MVAKDNKVQAKEFNIMTAGVVAAYAISDKTSLDLLVGYVSPDASGADANMSYAYSLSTKF